MGHSGWSDTHLITIYSQLYAGNTTLLNLAATETTPALPSRQVNLADGCGMKFSFHLFKIYHCTSAMFKARVSFTIPTISIGPKTL